MVLLERPWIASTFTIDAYREDEIELADEDEDLLFAEAEAEAAYDITVAILATMPLQTQSQSQTKSHQQPFPKHLVGQILATAEATNQLCSITMEPILTATAAITSCGHIFQRDAIAHWLTAHATCPECRQSCRI
jgi:SUMO ligase MMS21 Smc5/6 complex component